MQIGMGFRATKVLLTAVKFKLFTVTFSSAIICHGKQLQATPTTAAIDYKSVPAWEQVAISTKFQVLHFFKIKEKICPCNLFQNCFYFL